MTIMWFMVNTITDQNKQKLFKQNKLNDFSSFFLSLNNYRIILMYLNL